MLLFVYGTLTHKHILSAVLKRENNLPEYVPAVLHDYLKQSLNIFPYINYQVEGFILDIKDDKDWIKLDEYENVEGELYKRINVEVELMDNSKVQAIAYQLVGEYTF